MRVLLSIMFLVNSLACTKYVKAADESLQYYVLEDSSLICQQPVKSSDCESVALYGFSFFAEKKEGDFYFIRQAGPGVGYAGKWILAEDLVSTEKFSPVKSWDIRYLIINLEFFMDLYVFDSSGRYVVYRYFEDGREKKYEDRSQVYRYQNLLVRQGTPAGKGGRYFGEALGVVTGEGQQTICPVEYYRNSSTCDNYVAPVNKYSRWHALNYLQLKMSDEMRPIYFAGREISLPDVAQVEWVN